MKRALFVIALAVCTWLVFGAQDASWATQQPSKVKAGQTQHADLRLLSPGAAITVYLTDGSKIEGVLREVTDATIVVDHRKGGGSSTIPIADIQRLQSKGKGLHPVTRTLIIVGATIGALVVIAVAAC